MSSVIGQPRFTCAIGSQQTVLAIPHAIPITHCGPGCSSKAYSYLSNGAGYQGEGYAGGSIIPSSNSGEQEVVFGGEGKLTKLVEGTLKIMKGDLFVILSGCTAGIIGDDVKKIAGEFADQGYPVVGAETPGFKGNSYFGHELVVNEILDQYVTRQHPDAPQVRTGLVNLFASVPYQDAFWRADLEELKRVLEGVGLQVNVLFGYGSAGVSEWKSIPDAQLNIVVGPWVGLKAAEKLRDRYGTPLFHWPIFPVGAAATSDFLRHVGEAAGLDGGRVESFIKKEEARYYQYFIALCSFLSDMRNNTPRELIGIGDGLYALGTASFLYHELGFDVRSLYLIDDAPKSRKATVQAAIDALPAEVADKVHQQIDGYLIQQDMEPLLGLPNSTVILGSTWEAQIAREHQDVLVRLSLPINDDVIVTRSYCGYNGGLRLIEDIYAGLYRRGNFSRLTQTRDV